MPNFVDNSRVSWWFLHHLAAAFPLKPTPERRKSFVLFMENFAINYSCGVCGSHLANHLKTQPIYPATESRETLERYFYDLHESVNKRKGKPQMHTFEEVQRAFDITKSWVPFGEYPILPSKNMLGLDANIKQNLKNSMSDSNQNEKIFIWIIIALSLLLVIIASVAIYFFVKSKSNKVR